MFSILEIADTCELDIVGHRCNRVFQELGWGLTDHANCQDTLAEAIREYRLTPDDVHDSFNLWMATTIDHNGRRQFKWNPAQKGDRIDLLAMFDVARGGGDLRPRRPRRHQQLHLHPDQARGLRGLARHRGAWSTPIEERWGRMESQVQQRRSCRRARAGHARARAGPRLRARSYRPAPGTVTLELELEPTRSAGSSPA